MRRDSRLSRLLHVLLHMEEDRAPLTSEAIAKMIGSNPVLARRMMSGLREAGILVSERGHGGGWTLGRPLSEITLFSVYEALGEPEIFAFGLSNENPDCLVEQAVNNALEETRREARQKLLAQFASVRLSEIAADFSARRGEHKHHHPHHRHE